MRYGDIIVCTHTGKLGDFLYSLPVASWLHKAYGCRIHWVLANAFPPFRYIERLLKAQEMTCGFSLADVPITDFSFGGQPFRFDPGQYIPEVAGLPYFNFGFDSAPHQYVTAHYAEMHGLSWDPAFRLEVGPVAASGERLRSAELRMAIERPDIDPLPTVMDLLELARRLKAARERHMWYCGLAVLCYFLGIEQYIYREPGHPPAGIYFPDQSRIRWVHIEAWQPRMMERLQAGVGA